MSDVLQISRRTRVLGTTAVADRLDISVPHLRRLVRLGKLPKPIKIGARKCGWEEVVVDSVIVARRAAAEQAA